MSEFQFSCPACGQNISCDTAHAGAEITCPICQAAITVPKETAQRSSGLAIASLVCSLSSLITCIGWLPGIICGHMAKSRIRRNPALKGAGLATAGLVLGYLMLISEIGSTAFYVWRISTAVKHGFENARQNLATNNFIVVQSQPVTVSNATRLAERIPKSVVATNHQPAEPVKPAAVPVASPRTQPGNPAWTSDISTVSFPAHAVSGKVRGQDFTARAISLRPRELRIKSENGMQLDIYRLGNAIEGRSYEVRPRDSERDNPRVRIVWEEEDAVMTATFSKGYAMKLQFGEAINHTVTGKIYLCLPDTSKSFVAGTFEARLPRNRSGQTQ